MENAQVLKFTLLESQHLTLYFCGYSTTSPLHSFGPAVRSHYLIHYILNGKGIFQTDDKTYHLQAGQGFLITPDDLTFYQADQEDPWEYVWVGFDGKAVPEILTHIGISQANPVFQCDKKDELYWLINDMMVHSRFSFSSAMRRTGLLYQFLSVLAESSVTAAEPDNIENAYIHLALDYIKNNYWDTIRVYDIARYLNIDRSYLYTLFLEHMNQSPQEYLTTFRLSRAAALLSTTSYSVEQISISCGYSNPATFSKAFKRFSGFSPSDYRKEDQKKSAK